MNFLSGSNYVFGVGVAEEARDADFIHRQRLGINLGAPVLGFLPHRIDGGDAQDVPFQLARQIVVLEHDVQRLVPGHVIEHDGQRALDDGIENDVQTADLVNQPEEILQIHIFKIDRDRLAGVLGLRSPRASVPAAPSARRPDSRLAGWPARCRRSLPAWRHGYWWRPVPRPSCRQSGSAASWAFTAGSAGWFAEYLGSTKAKSAGFSAFATLDRGCRAGSSAAATGAGREQDQFRRARRTALRRLPVADGQHRIVDLRE